MESSTVERVRALVRLAVKGEGAVHEVRALTAGPPYAWEEALALLEENRLIGRVGQALIEADLAPAFPASLERHLRTVVAEKQARNLRRMARWAELAAELRARSIEPILLKSTALVALLHADQAAHEMSDVDVLVAPGQLPAVEALLRERGLRLHERQADAADWRDPDDALRVDLHHAFRMFGSRDLPSLVMEREATCPGLGTVTMLGPDANLAHLVFHLNAHRPVLGYRLRWIVDIAVTLRAFGHELSWVAIEYLLPEARHQAWVLRMVRFCEEELRVAIRGSLPAVAAGIEPFTVEEVLRSQRIDPWRLRRSVGAWVRLGACMLGVRRSDRLVPRPGDALGWARDRLREHRALRSAARISRLA